MQKFYATLRTEYGDVAKFLTAIGGARADDRPSCERAA